jgi:uncharacterized FlaG/YvyC family protein
MDTASIRQAYTAVPVQAARPDGFVTRDAVQTELPARQTVASPWEGSAVRTDVTPYGATLTRLAQLMQRPTEQRFERDRKTETLVYKQVDPSTGQVILQLPDQSLLNLRAYLKEQEALSAPSVAKTA